MSAFQFGAYRLTTPRMGKLPSDPDRDDIRINRAVHSIQVRLKALGFDPRRTDGVFGYFTDRAVKKFQRSLSMTPDGQVWSTECRELLRGTVIHMAEQHDVPIEYLGGIAVHESGMDPGATHDNDDGSVDRGLVQINDTSHPEVKDREAFTARYALDWESAQLRASYERFITKPLIAWDCAICVNKSPVAAQQWFQMGTAPNDEVEKFVDDVKALGRMYFG